jgi:hypothetical protein
MLMEKKCPELFSNYENFLIDPVSVTTETGAGWSVIVYTDRHIISMRKPMNVSRHDMETSWVDPDGAPELTEQWFAKAIGRRAEIGASDPVPAVRTDIIEGADLIVVTPHDHEALPPKIII